MHSSGQIAKSQQSQKKFGFECTVLLNESTVFGFIPECSVARLPQVTPGSIMQIPVTGL